METKILVKIFVNEKDLYTRKLNINDKLSEIRKKIKYENKKNVFFMNGESRIAVEDENEVNLEDILQDKKIYLKEEVIKLYIDNKNKLDIAMSKEESLKSMIEKYSKILPSDFNFLDKAQRTIKKEDAIDDEEILIEDVLNDNIINIISIKEKTNEKKECPQDNISEKEINQTSEMKLTVKICRNNKDIAYKKLSKETKLSDLRKILSDIMTDKAYFTKGGIPIDENEFCLNDIIQDNSIYIQDDYIEKKNNMKEMQSDNKKDYGPKETKENQTISIIENGKKKKMKKLNVNEKLSDLRSLLELPVNASFIYNDGADIDFKDENLFNISDIIIDNSIHIKREESQQYIIYFNNQILLKQNLEPSKDVASLRNLLSLQINDKAYYINANTHEKIKNEDEQFFLLSKISNNQNEIFIEQEIDTPKRVTELIKGSQLLKEDGRLKIFKYNCVT